MAVMVAKSRRVKELLVGKIRNGDFLPGQKIHSERKLSEEYGIARATAAKVLEELASDGLVRREHGSGTFVNEIPQKISNITYLYNNAIPTDYPWLTKLLAGMERTRLHKKFRLNIHGVSVPSANSQNIGHVIDDVQYGIVDGLLINVDIDDDIMIELERNNVPLVFIENRHPYLGRSWPMVGVDLFQVASQAVRHLYDQGYRRIQLMCGLNPRGLAREHFVNGFNQALTDLKIDNFNRIHQCGWSAGESRALFLERYGKDKPDAVICSDDIQALGVIQARNELNLTSSELGIVGVGNLQAMRDDIELTTFDTHVERIGEIAMGELINLIEGEFVDVLNKYIEPKLIAKNSSLRWKQS